MFSQKLRAIWHDRYLRSSLLFLILMIFVFRIAAHIPVPGVNIENLKAFFQSNQILGLLSIFSGGGIENFSIVAIGVAPYITSSIIFQLLTMISPRLEELSKEQGGYEKINRWTRLMTVPLALLQSYALISLLKQQSQLQIITNLSLSQTLLTMLTLTAGTIMLMWMGELITERKIGNGLSLIIFAGIVAALPGYLQRFLATYDSTQLVNVIVFAAIVVLTIATVVIINEATRNVPVSYARHIRSGGSGGVSTSLPLRVNTAGMIPIIFAISLILFPSLIAQFTLHAKSQWLVAASRFTINLFQNQLFYGAIYFVLVFAFTYFYTAVVFHPEQVAENLQKQGGFIPGIRPGEATKHYLAFVSGRIVFVGALFLATIAVIPIVIQQTMGTGNLTLGASSVLIVVAVVIDMVKQIESHLTMRDYNG